VRLAFGTGALASGVTAAVVTGLVIWVVSLLLGWSDPWPTGAWLILVAGVVVALAAYLAEWIAYRRTLAEMRSTGEPWAYRDRG
jgi:hypothetical protein